jgi:hypothetical protein
LDWAPTRRRGRCCTATGRRWYIGGVEDKVHGRETETKAIVAIAVEIENPKGFGRIRLGHVPDVTKESMLPFIDGAVQPGSTIRVGQR